MTPLLSLVIDPCLKDSRLVVTCLYTIYRKSDDFSVTNLATAIIFFGNWYTNRLELFPRR